jgi:ATP-binding cassette subfamily B (MDR/TAP) protein 8
MGSASRIFEYVELEPSIPTKGGIILDGFRGEIEFRNVSFSYPTRPDQSILTKFNLRIPQGKVVALCGASGGGKSTVGALIERFYDSDGAVYVDGINLKDLDPSWLRQKIGYINQEPGNKIELILLPFYIYISNLAKNSLVCNFNFGKYSLWKS